MRGLLGFSGACVATILATFAAEQVKSRTRKFDPEFARSLLAVKDQDGDGLRELLIANSAPSDGGPVRFYIWSPGANRCLRSFDHGTRMAGSVDEMTTVEGIEGADAVYVGLHSAGEGASLILFSTSTGEEVRRLRLDYYLQRGYGWSRVCALGNIDGELGDEVFVQYRADRLDCEGDCGLSEGLVVSLRTGKILRASNADGHAVVSDLDGDGVREYVVYADSASVHDGRSGRLKFELESREVGHPLMSWAVHQPAGDLDGDGVTDFLEVFLAADDEGVLTLEGTDYFASSQSRARSGSSGEVLWSADPIGCTGYTACRTAVTEDLDADGIVDLIVCNSFGWSLSGGCPDWRILSGRTGEVIVRFPWQGRLDGFSCRGTSLALLDDLDGDGRSDLALSHSTPRYKGMWNGYVSLYSTRTGHLRDIRLEDVSPPDED